MSASFRALAVGKDAYLSNVPIFGAIIEKGVWRSFLPSRHHLVRIDLVCDLDDPDTVFLEVFVVSLRCGYGSWAVVILDQTRCRVGIEFNTRMALFKASIDSAGDCGGGGV